jgi:heptaprenyl diphosphate synthase
MGKKFKKKEDELIKLAAAIETIHLATLVHDDIIDQSELRRGQPSIQAKYGQSYAVYMGDYLLTKCFLMLTHLDLDKELAIRLAKIVSKICVGDIKQHQKKYDVSITPYQYIKIVAGKTCALIAIALSSGAYHTGTSKEHVKTLGKIGFKIGMIFQLVDDLLDYEGDSSVVGKDLQMDIYRGYYSMPIIFALQEGEPYSRELKAILNDQMSSEDLDKVYDLIRKSGSIEKTKHLIEKYYNKTNLLIDALPNGDVKEFLRNLLPYLVSRVH